MDRFWARLGFGIVTIGFMAGIGFGVRFLINWEYGWIVGAIFCVLVIAYGIGYLIDKDDCRGW